MTNGVPSLKALVTTAAIRQAEARKGRALTPAERRTTELLIPPEQRQEVRTILARTGFGARPTRAMSIAERQRQEQQRIAAERKAIEQRRAVEQRKAKETVERADKSVSELRNEATAIESERRRLEELRANIQKRQISLVQRSQPFTQTLIREFNEDIGKFNQSVGAFNSKQANLNREVARAALTAEQTGIDPTRVDFVKQKFAEIRTKKEADPTQPKPRVVLGEQVMPTPEGITGTGTFKGAFKPAPKAILETRVGLTGLIAKPPPSLEEQFTAKAGKELIAERTAEAFGIPELRKATVARAKEEPVEFFRQLSRGVTKVGTAPAIAFADVFAGLAGFGFGKAAIPIGKELEKAGKPPEEALAFIPFGGAKFIPEPVTAEEVVGFARAGGEFAGTLTLFELPAIAAKTPSIKPLLKEIRFQTKDVLTKAFPIKKVRATKVESIFKYPPAGKPTGMRFTVSEIPSKVETARVEKILRGQREFESLQKEAAKRSRILFERKAAFVPPKFKPSVSELRREAVLRSQILKERKLSFVEPKFKPSVSELRREAVLRSQILKQRKLSFVEPKFKPTLAETKRVGEFNRQIAKIRTLQKTSVDEWIKREKELSEIFRKEVLSRKILTKRTQEEQLKIFKELFEKPKLTRPEDIFKQAEILKKGFRAEEEFFAKLTKAAETKVLVKTGKDTFQIQLMKAPRVKPKVVRDPFSIPGSLEELSIGLPRVSKTPTQLLFERELAGLRPIKEGVKPVVKTGFPEIDEFVKRGIGIFKEKPLFGKEIERVSEEGLFDLSGEEGLISFIKELREDAKKGLFAPSKGKTPLEREIEKTVTGGLKFGEFLGTDISPALALAMKPKEKGKVSLQEAQTRLEKELRKEREKQRAREQEAESDLLRNLTAAITTPITTTALKEKLVLKELTQLEQIKPARRIQKIKFDPFRITKEEKIPKEPVPTRKPPPPEFPILPLFFEEPRKKRKAVKGRGYDVLLKVRGQFVKQNVKPLHKSTAIALGAFLADKTAAQTFKPRKTGRKATGVKKRTSRLRKFRKPIRKGRPQKGSPLFIERKKFLIDSPGERKAITAAGLKALRTSFFAKKKRKKKRKRRR